jgi:choline dehydrogenase-like flavoprotein
MTELSDGQRAILRSVCDTVVPSIDHADDGDGFWARAASDLDVDGQLEQLLATMPAEQQAGMRELLDGLAEQGFATASQRSREQLLRNIALLGPAAASGVGALTGLTLFLAYGAPDPATGRNPNWSVFGYPGPIVAPPAEPKRISPLVPEGDTLTLDADVCVVGSGAGGGVVAAALAEQGSKVVVLEAGGYFNEADFNQLELWAYQNLYYRGGPVPTTDLNVTLQAGSTLGGGTVVNWSNCLRTKPRVREQWAREFGLEGVDGPDFDRHLDAVLARLSANDRCSDFNGPTQRLQAGAESLGWSFSRCVRNADASRYDPASAGYMGFGDPSGSKQSTLRTYLQDASDAGADIVVRCHADEVLTDGGRASGVSATWSDPDTGRTAQVTVHARHVVVAAGALESPALLLRSGLGGTAVGDHLRLHPCTALFGVYAEDQQAWWGAPHTGLVDEFAGRDDGYGFLVETAQYAPALTGSSMPFSTAAEHKQSMTRVRNGATFIGLVRDHGHGRVTIDEQGAAQHWYALTDERDVHNTHGALAAQARLHHAAGALEIYAMAEGAPRWRWGDDLDGFIARLQRIPLRADGHRLFAAHQMGTCRMGADPATSVADPFGELHDTPGVWIGDASAFPTSSGTNPMISIMALARRTAEAITGAELPPAAATHAGTAAVG